MLTKNLLASGLGLLFASLIVASHQMTSTTARAQSIDGRTSCAPAADTVTPGGPVTAYRSLVGMAEPRPHTYFETLSARRDCLVAYHMRSEAQLNSVDTGKSGISQRGERRFPITYDSVMDAALVRIDPRIGSTDSESKRFPIAVSSGSMLLTWDLRFDDGHAYLGQGYLGRHKTYQIGWYANANGNNRWLGFKTEYKNAAQAYQGIAELFLNMAGTKWHGPGTRASGQDILEPRFGKFYIETDTWTRVWVWIQDIEKPVAYLTVWIADENRDPFQMYDRLAVIPPPGGIAKFWLEYDTSLEDALNAEMRSWNRNLVVLKDVPPQEIGQLLQRP